MKLVLERQIQLAFVLALLLLATLGFFAYRNADSLGKAVEREKHTREVLERLDNTLTAALNVETGGRGFIITGDESFLEPFDGANEQISGDLAKLRELTADNLQQSAEIPKLEALMTEKLDFIRMTGEIRRNQGLEAASGRTQSGDGKRIMDKIRQSIGAMHTEEYRLLDLRADALDKTVGNTMFLLFLGIIAGIVSLSLANFAIFREVGKRGRAEADLKESNRNLEKRVEARTVELTEKNAELKEQIKHREQSEKRRRIALEAGSLGTWILDPQNNKAEIDERSLALFGLAAEDFDGSGEKVFSRIHAEDFPTIEQLFQKSVLERANFNAEFRVSMPDGSVRWNQCHGQPQTDENGEITQVVGHCRDITEHKRSELTLRESEFFNRAVLDSLPAHIAVVDKDGVITAVNRAWQNFARANCLEEQIGSTGVGQNYLKVCETGRAFEKDAKDVLGNLRAVLADEKSGFAFEYSCHSPDEERWFILQVSAMRGAEKGGAVISHFDITDRKKAEIELKNSEQFNRSIFENSPDCVKVLELDGTLSAMNSNGLCVLEIDDFAHFAGKQWIDFWEGDENEMAYQAVQSAAKGKTAQFEGFCKTAKGTTKYWDVSVAPVFDAEGKPNRLISTSRDISERRQIEREREELLRREQAARRDAEIANRMRDEFLATVSHELRAPLSSILGWARLMEKGKLDEPTRQKAVGTIVRNAESQNRLIEDLLDVSRIISGKLRLEVITLKPINVVESALETVRPAAEAKGIKLEIKETPDVSHIAGDPNRLQQVIWNLLSNAIKFTPNGGEVSIGIERRGDYTEIKVTDTGVGIKEEFLPHVFERFRQADASSIRKFGGLGLGLAIVRHITEMHGGTVSVESNGENKGSTFTVRLPLLSSPAETDDSAATEEFLRKTSEETQNFNLAGLLILVVDDEKDTRQLLVQALTFHGATVETAASVSEALQVVETKNPDVLVSDIGMPDEDGYSLIRKVRALPDARHKNISAVALTAFTRAQDRMRALSAGYQNHVSKPVDLDELATVIASLTGRLQINDED
ncbi:MAG TPA: CHASE3 domain-containing protein [Pyrinomonadaceae bacterium]|nr:CHASE3 domain-containing protein [Pyrinomonadaceae bacterium]